MSEKELQPLVTQCPNCHTQFRVSESQLQIASGKVRCGACLTVFQGVDNLVWEEGQEPAEHGDLDELIDEIDAVAEVDDAPAPAPPADEEPAAASVQESKPPPKETLGGGVAVELSADSARDITLDDLEAELLGAPISRPASADDGPVPGAAPDIDLIPSEDLEAVKRRDRERTLADAAERLAARQAEPSAQQEPSAPSALKEPSAQQEPPGANGPSAPAAAPPESLLPKRSTTTETMPALAASALADEASDSQVTEDDPFARLEAHQRANKPELPAPRRSVWPMIGITFGILLLLAQVLLLRFDAWSQNPSIRPVYVAACAVLPCSVPSLRATGQLRTIDSAVRSHPDVENALLVDVLFANQAEFAQAFPLIELTFRDLNGNVVAGRRFKPEEYLQGAMVGETEIPSRTPVRIQLEIEDPGTDVPNYEIKYL